MSQTSTVVGGKGQCASGELSLRNQSMQTLGYAEFYSLLTFMILLCCRLHCCDFIHAIRNESGQSDLKREDPLQERILLILRIYFPVLPKSDLNKCDICITNSRIVKFGHGLIPLLI